MLKPRERIARLAVRLNASRVNSRVRVSLRGVPHIVVDRKPFCYSVAYFGKTRVYRVFYPYAVFNSKQTKWDFKDEDEVIRFFTELSGITY